MPLGKDTRRSAPQSNTQRPINPHTGQPIPEPPPYVPETPSPPPPPPPPPPDSAPRIPTNPQPDAPDPREHESWKKAWSNQTDMKVQEFHERQANPPRNPHTGQAEPLLPDSVVDNNMEARKSTVYREAEQGFIKSIGPQGPRLRKTPLGGRQSKGLSGGKFFNRKRFSR